MRDLKPSANPRPWRLQFSLKLLFAAFTAFAIGFPIWYRWPYEETEWNRTKTARIVSTWRREWGGGRKKHGPQQQIVNGEVIESLVYRDGMRHGPYVSKYDRGEFVNDRREGVWTGPDRTMTWHLGKLDGPAEIRLPAAVRSPTARRNLLETTGGANGAAPSLEDRVYKLRFVEGRLTEFNGKPASNRLFDRLQSDAIDQRAANELRKTTHIDVVHMPLKDTLLYLTEVHNLPIMLDPKAIPQSDMPMTHNLRGIDLCSALLLLTAPHGLASDYRYGCVWITTAEDGNDWHDPTGVAGIKPPEGSPIQKAWKEISPPVDCVRTPLTEVLAYLKQPLAIDIDTSPINQDDAEFSPPLVTLNLRGLRFCDTLGQLLYRTHCRCRLEGDKLVILPPDSEVKHTPRDP